MATAFRWYEPILNFPTCIYLTQNKIGYGTGTAWYKSGDESKTDQACIDAAKMSINMGYYHQDGAEVYKTETELGTAIKQSGVSREKLYVVTKVISNIADIPSALKTSLKKLQTDYVDLYVPIPKRLGHGLIYDLVISSTRHSSVTRKKNTNRSGSRWRN